MAMTNSLITFAYYLLGWVLLSIVLSWVSAALYPLFSRQLNQCSPQRATNYTFFFSLLPPLAASLSILILASPELAFPLVASHCHNESCAPHTVHIEMSTLLSSSSLALGAAAILVLCISMLWQIRGNHRYERMLQQLSETDTLGYRWFDSQRPIARCIGLFKPQVYFSTGLLRVMTEEQQELVLAQNLVRAARHENLSYWLLKWASIAWPNALKHRIRRDFLQHSACACDISAFKMLADKTNKRDFVKTLESIYAKQYNPKQQPWRERLDIFQHAVDTTSQDKLGGIWTALSMTIKLTAYTTLLVIAAVYLGHPVLEVFSR
ncbi:hypothetical protein NBRC116587_13300 [Pseudoteredinibacter isoporae]